mgnify:CR=1 FL=1
MKFSTILSLAAVLSAGVAVAQSQPAARVGTADVSIADVDAIAAERLTKVRNEEYQIRRQVLDGLIEKRLIEAEAAARGVSAAELEKSEITSKVEAVTLEQTRAVYESAPEKYTSMSQEQALSQIATVLQRTRLAAARKEFLTSARKKYGVKVFLDAPRVVIDSAGAPTKGPAGAAVTMIAFSDFQCPYCVRVNPTLKALEAKYPGKLRIAFKDFPLGIHKEARKASEAGQCAAEQGKFWEMHDKMFANQQKLQPDSLKAFAKEVGLDGATFASCLDSGKTAARVAADVAQGAKHGVTGTPTFFINGRFLSGAHSIEKFTEIIDEELSRAQGGRP